MSKTILIVDDSRLSLQMIQTFVKAHFPHWTIVTAANANEALARAAEAPFDCATLDYNMPGMDGIELGKRLKQHYPLAKIALLTANVQEAIIKKAQEAGLEFIPKPVTEQKILQFGATVE
jgi:CheY-like chemotaxis protein